jgi:superfamily II DNA/RNA helicase
MPEPTALSRDDLATKYLEQLPYAPYPVQEEALLTWFSTDEGVLVCAPTGTGKTLIAEAALFEALHTRKPAYYTTPLIALTDQKFQEMQAAAVRWGFSADDVGLVTGNRSVNPKAIVRVVVAEILLNRLLHPDAFDFSDVSAVVMDEFHSFADPERGIVWELSLGMLPKHVRLMLLSATVGNALDFVLWLNRCHNRNLELVQSTERKIPLEYVWVGDDLLNEHLEKMADGDDTTRKTPALVFVFNRDECWDVAEQMKGKNLLATGQQKRLADELAKLDLSKGAGPKLKTILQRGVGVHHAGILPRYRRVVEELFQKKLLSVCICTETLAAGINLPARSVVLTTLMKGPPGKKKLIDPSSAHQMFGRAGRPQFDTEGFVYVLAHEDDVKIQRWKEKYDQIPEDTRDPQLIAAKKKMKKSAPTRRSTEQYWNEEQYRKLIASPPGKLASKGLFPFRLLAYLLTLSPEVERIRSAVSRRLTDAKALVAGQKQLNRMLMTLWAGGYVKLDPEPPPPPPPAGSPEAAAQPEAPQQALSPFAKAMLQAREENLAKKPAKSASSEDPGKRHEDLDDGPEDSYQPVYAHPTPDLARLLVFRSINPVYGDFLVKQLGIADRNEIIQAFESVLEIPGSVAPMVRVPKIEELPPGPLAIVKLDQELLSRGLCTPDQLRPYQDSDGDPRDQPFKLKLGEKLKLLFDSEFPGVGDMRVTPVWAAGELLHQGGDFNRYVTSGGMAKQEGVLFRHMLRLILLCGEFSRTAPLDRDAGEWRTELREITDALTASCRAVDPDSTDKMIENLKEVADVTVEA